MRILDVKDLKITYGKTVAVRSLDLHVDEGEFVSLIGHNGVGKSSTIKAIAGVVTPAAGSVTFLDQVITGKNSAAILSQGLAVVPEGRRIFTRLTVRENLLVGATVCSSRSQVADSFAEMGQRFPVLEKYANRMAGLLSGGEQQQLAIARALMSKPKMLLLDEPTLGLAPRLVEQVFDLLGELNNQGMSILLIEQNAMQAIQASDRYYVMRTGGAIETEAVGGESVDVAKIESDYLNFGTV